MQITEAGEGFGGIDTGTVTGQWQAEDKITPMVFIFIC